MKREATLKQSVLALVAATALASATRMSVPSNVLMGIYQDKTVSSSVVTYIEPIFGINPKSKKSGQVLQTIIDVNFVDVYLLDGKTSPKGVDCVEDKSCSIDYAENATCQYQGLASIGCSPAQTYLRFFPVSIPDLGIARLQFKLFNATSEWKETIGQKSILGLHSSSPFWNYIRDAFDEGQFDFSIVYQLDDKSEILDPEQTALADSFWIVNGRFEMNDPIMQTQDSILNNGAWTFKDMTVNFSSSVEGPAIEGSGCIDNTINAYLMVLDSQPIKQSIFKRLCGTAEGCEKKNSNLKNLQNWVVTYSGSSSRGKKQSSDTIQIQPDEYVNFLDNGTAVLGLTDLNSSTACSQKKEMAAAFGVGRLFLSKVEFIIRFNSSSSSDSNLMGNFTIGFNKITYPDDTIFLIILFILAVLIVILVVIISLARVLNRKKNQGSIETMEDSYKNTNDS